MLRMRLLLCFVCFLWLANALAAGSLAAAQSNTLGLSSDDYALWRAANGVPVNRFTFQYTASLAVQGLDTFAITADVKGAGAIDTTVRAADLSLNGPVQLGSTQMSILNTEVKWVGDTLYFNPGDGWQARSKASAFIADLITQVAGLNATASGVAQWDVSKITGLTDILKAAQAIDLAPWVSVKRLADVTTSSLQTAHFQINANLQSLMQTDKFVDLVLAVSGAQGTEFQAFDRKK
jgi:hypothetical protein